MRQRHGGEVRGHTFSKPASQPTKDRNKANHEGKEKLSVSNFFIVLGAYEKGY